MKGFINIYIYINICPMPHMIMNKNHFNLFLNMIFRINIFVIISSHLSTIFQWRQHVNCWVVLNIYIYICMYMRIFNSGYWALPKFQHIFDIVYIAHPFFNIMFCYMYILKTNFNIMKMIKKAAPFCYCIF